MVDNLNLIKPFLVFESEDDFYYLQILQRKKENPNLGSNSRVIKSYYIKSLDYLENRYEEIKVLCNTFNARAMLRLNKRSWEKVAFKTIVNVANSTGNKEYEFIRKSYDKACGNGHNDKQKKWILDIDFDKESRCNEDDIEAYCTTISNCQPFGRKVLAKIPSKNGLHIITTPFNIQEWKKHGRENLVDIHKDNPTNLYIP